MSKPCCQTYINLYQHCVNCHRSVLRSCVYLYFSLESQFFFFKINGFVQSSWAVLLNGTSFVFPKFLWVQWVQWDWFPPFLNCLQKMSQLWPHLWRCFSTTLLEWTIFFCTKNIPGPEMSVYLCFHLPSPQLPRGCLRVQVHNEIPRNPYDGISIQHQKNVYLSHTANQLWRKEERIQFFFLMGKANCDSFFITTCTERSHKHPGA